MGVYNENCRLTNTEIQLDDPCLVVIAKCKDRLFYDFLHDIRLDMPVIQGVYSGTYNEYGGLNEIQLPEIEGCELHFFHKFAINCLFEWMFFEDVFSSFNYNDNTRMHLTKALYNKLNSLRKNPIGFDCIGSQGDDIEQMQEKIRLNNRINEHLAEKIAKAKSDEAFEMCIKQINDNQNEVQ